MSLVVDTPEFPVFIADHSDLPSVFLGGGISGCPDWQSEMILALAERKVDALAFNPRRENWPGVGSDGPEAREQIRWEQIRLQFAEIHSYWFPEETLCPITLMELGLSMKSKKALFVGCHPGYQRRFDVVEQLAWYRPNVVVVDSVEALALGIDRIC